MGRDIVAIVVTIAWVIVMTILVVMAASATTPLTLCWVKWCFGVTVGPLLTQEDLVT